MISQEYLEKFKLDHQQRLNKKTIKIYEIAISQLLSFSKERLDEITKKDIREWLNQFHVRGYQPVTIKAKLAAVKLFFRYCVEESILSEDPAASIPFPQIDERLPNYLDYEQLIQLRKLVEGELEERAMIEVLYATGVRISELAEMKKEDIDWSERMIHVPNGKRKKARIVLFTREGEQRLKAYLATRKDDTTQYVFLNTTKTGPICIRTVEKKFEKYSKVLGIKLTPHTMRHTFAAHLAQKGMPIECIQELLGHNSSHQTQLYARLYDHARKELYDQWM